MANTLTTEAVAWIRQQHRVMAPWRVAAILGTDEATVTRIAAGGDPPAPRASTSGTRSPKERHGRDTARLG